MDTRENKSVKEKYGCLRYKGDSHLSANQLFDAPAEPSKLQEAEAWLAVSLMAKTPYRSRS